MKPSQVRSHVLADHERLRGLLRSLEQAGRRAIGAGKQEAVSLRDEAAAFLARLREHMEWEDRYLRSALLEADAWGRERVRGLDAGHREQRELLDFVLGVVVDRSRPADLVARNVLDLVALVRGDMIEEERWLLDARVLRDDVIAIDGESG
jgi:hypothetical protein